MHIAAACDKPLLALFGQTSIERWRPLSTQAESLYHEESVDLIDPHLIARLIQSLLRLRESK